MKASSLHPLRLILILILGIIAGCSRGPALSPEELAEPLQIRAVDKRPVQVWRTKLPSPPSALQPLSPNALLITTHRGELYRLELETGERKSPIHQPLRKAITAELLHREEAHLFIASAWDNELRAYHLLEGKAMWKRKAAGITGQMALSNGLLFTTSISGEVAAYNISDGSLVWWSRLPGRIYQGVWNFDHLVLVLDDQGSLYAFETRPPSGQSSDPEGKHPHQWKRELPVSPNATIAGQREKLVIADSQGKLLSMNPLDGQMHFQVVLDAPIYSRPLVTDSLIVVATATGEIIALHHDDGHTIWRVPGEGLVKHPILANLNPEESQSLLVTFAKGLLLALDLRTGRELWRYDMEKPVGLVSLIPDGLVLTDRRNVLYGLRLTKSAIQVEE